VLNGEQIDGEVGAEPIAHIGKEEVQGIKPSRVGRGIGRHNGPLNTKNAPAAIKAEPTG
jgi:hypothetical protein